MKNRGQPPGRSPAAFQPPFETAKNPPAAERTPLSTSLYTLSRPAATRRTRKNPHLSARLRRVPSPASSTSIGSSSGRAPPLPRSCDARPGLNPMMTAALSGASRRCLCFGLLIVRHFGAIDKGYVRSRRFRGLPDRGPGSSRRPPQRRRRSRQRPHHKHRTRRLRVPQLRRLPDPGPPLRRETRPGPAPSPLPLKSEEQQWSLTTRAGRGGRAAGPGGFIRW